MTDRVVLHRRAAPQARGGAALALVLLCGSCLAIQGSAAVATPLFDRMSPPAVAAWRQLFAAVCLVLLLRPSLRGRDRHRWFLISLLGIAMAAMNTSYYLSVERLPLGVAASLIYLGPFVVAVASIRRAVLLIWPLLALGGVLAITRPDQISSSSLTGIVLGLVAAVSLAAYTVTSHRLGRQAALPDLALAVCVSALVLTPVSLTHLPPSGSSVLVTLVLLGVLGVALPFSFDFLALRLGGPTLVATLFALDPAMGALLGLIVLGQTLAWPAVAGLAAICLAGAGLTLAGVRER